MTSKNIPGPAGKFSPDKENNEDNNNLGENISIFENIENKTTIRSIKTHKNVKIENIVCFIKSFNPVSLVCVFSDGFDEIKAAVHKNIIEKYGDTFSVGSICFLNDITCINISTEMILILTCRNVEKILESSSNVSFPSLTQFRNEERNGDDNNKRKFHSLDDSFEEIRTTLGFREQQSDLEDEFECPNETRGFRSDGFPPSQQSVILSPYKPKGMFPLPTNKPVSQNSAPNSILSKISSTLPKEASTFMKKRASVMERFGFQSSADKVKQKVSFMSKISASLMNTSSFDSTSDFQKSNSEAHETNIVELGRSATNVPHSDMNNLEALEIIDFDDF
jgi:hypothetical protein